MKKRIYRNFLEIKSIKFLNEKKRPHKDLKIEKLEIENFQINKFFYKQIGKNYSWKDRLIWTDNHWMRYVNDKDVHTYILKKNVEFIGFYELIHHKNKNEIEIAYFGILPEYFEKGMGGFMLTEAIKSSFTFNVNRVWVHTCSLDHSNALKNYLARGMKIFLNEFFEKKRA
tara:strand:- start:540 stop:1052 length:513 start_codon:yes stop_codon:yes gene_type:complete